MLNSTEIKSIVSSGEGFNAEFKVNLPTNLKSITEEVCAFANASGGVAFIGVDDKNIIKGVTEKIYFDEASCKEIDINKDIPKENIDTFRFEAGFDSLDKRYIIEDKTMTGTLFQQYQQSMILLKSKLSIYDLLNFESWVNHWVNHLSEKNIIILKSIHENQEIKKPTLQQLTDFSPSTLDYNIEILKKNRFIRA